MPLFLLAGAIGAAIAYFFDPENGNRRRQELAKRSAKKARQAGRQAQGFGAQASGLKARATHRQEQEKPQPDDVTLARKVETEIFRDADVPKGRINVNAEDGVVFLRGEVEPDLAQELAMKAARVQGVLGVENLLHAPGQEAPAKSD